MNTSISKLFRFPVKSMMGERCDSLQISSSGTVGDRVWAVRDEKRGGIRGGKKIPSLMTLGSRFIDAASAEGSSPAIITAPDGERRETGAGDINDWLSAKLSHPVTLWPLLPANALDHYRRGAPDNEDMEQELREMFARTPDEPLPDLELFAEVMEYESPPGTYFDAFPLLIMSEQSLASMGAHREESEFDVSRFRPNILVNCAAAEHPFPENAWVGKQLKVGEVVLDVVGECPRCAMTTHGFADLPKDPGIMRALVQANGGNLGVYAKVVETGTISTGDVLEICGGET
jgi:uncharacterized protein YcbX